MKLNRLHLIGFGKFSDKWLEFGPGLNLVYGENESGKSTIQHFLRGMLFGLKKPGTRRAYDELLERYRPWGGGSYAGAIEYSLDQGTFRVERNFIPEQEEVRVLDGITWQDITGQFAMDRRKEVLFAQEHLGISQGIFDNTVCVRQLHSKSSSDLASEISTKLANLASAGEEDVSVQNAIQVLETGLRDIGLSERSSKTPLGKISAKVEELEKARQQTLSVYEEIRATEAKQQELLIELELLTQKHDRLNIIKQAVEARELEARLHRVGEYDQKLAELTKALQHGQTLGNFPLALKDKLLLATDRLKTGELKVQDLVIKSEDLARRVNGLKQTLTGLETYAAFSQESVQTMEGAFTRLEEAAHQAERLEQKRGELLGRRRALAENYQKLSGCGRLGAAGEAEVNQLEEEINELRLKAWSLESDRLKLNEHSLAHKVKLRNILAFALGGGGLVLGAGLGITVSWVFGILSLFGIVFFIGQWLINGRDKRKLGEIRQRINANADLLKPIQMELAAKDRRVNELLAEAEVNSSRELYEKMRQWTLFEHTNQTVALELVDLENELSKLHQKVREEANFLTAGFLEPTGIVNSNRHICRADMEQFMASLGHYQKVKAELFLVMEKEQENSRELELARIDLAQAKQETQRILAEAGVKCVEEFLSKWDLAQKLSEVRKEWDAISLARNEVVGEFSLEELQSTLQTLNAELERAGWGWVETLPDKQEIIKELNTCQEKFQAAKESIAKLEGIIKTRLEGVTNLAEVEGELLEAWQEKERILKRRQALELARHTISEVAQAVQRDYAPLVNQHMAQTISSITAGRYLASRIDEQLNVKLKVPEVGEVKDVANLSLGTVDQIYFSLRLALADLLGVKFPLLLDEPFSQYDDNRLRAVLILLLQLAEHRQIVLFTCHRRELDILHQLAPANFKIVALSA